MNRENRMSHEGRGISPESVAFKPALQWMASEWPIDLKLVQAAKFTRWIGQLRAAVAAEDEIIGRLMGQLEPELNQTAAGLTPAERRDLASKCVRWAAQLRVSADVLDRSFGEAGKGTAILMRRN